MDELYICDREKKMAEGKCTGTGCINNNDCFLTKDKEYAKEYVSIFEAEKYFSYMVEQYTMKNDLEKAGQYYNALKGVREAIVEQQKEAEEKEAVFIDCLYEQLKLFEDLLDDQT